MYTLDSIGELGFGISIGSLTGNEKAMDFAHGFDCITVTSKVIITIITTIITTVITAVNP